MDGDQVDWDSEPSQNPEDVAWNYLEDECALPGPGEFSHVIVAECEETTDLLSEDDAFDGYEPGQVWHRKIGVRRVEFTVTSKVIVLDTVKGGA